MPEYALTSVAILKVNWDLGKSYLSNFVPFVAECLRRAPQPEVSTFTLQQCLQEEFGFEIPHGALTAILKRAARDGYAKRRGGIYIRNDSRLEKLDFSRKKDEALRNYEGLVTKLIRFCREKHNIEWERRRAERALEAYLHQHAGLTLSWVFGDSPAEGVIETDARTEFLVSKFLLEIFQGDPEGFAFVETVVKGALLANVVYFPDLSRLTEHFHHVDVYLDTGFILYALGLAGNSKQVVCQELLDLLYGLNVNLRVFEHTVHEIEGVLHAKEIALRTGASDTHTYDIDVYFQETGVSASDVEMIIAQLPSSLTSMRIEVNAKPPGEISLTIDENALASVLRKKVGFAREETLLKDIDSLTAIYRLRRGRPHPRVEACRALFVTTNTKLARVSADFFRAEFDIASIPLCLTDDQMTTIAWLKRPSGAPDCPRKKLIADCYAALNPPDALWRRYLGEIDKLHEQGDISDEDFHILRFTSVAKATLMERTFGDVDVFVRATVQEVLEAAKADIRAETERELAAETTKRIEVENRLKLLEAEMTMKEQAEAFHFKSLGARGGRWIARIVFVLFTGFIALVTYLSTPSAVTPLSANWLKLFMPSLLVLGWLWSVWSQLFGTHVRSVSRRVEVSSARLVERAVRRVSKPSSAE